MATHLLVAAGAVRLAELRDRLLDRTRGSGEQAGLGLTRERGWERYEAGRVFATHLLGEGAGVRLAELRVRLGVHGFEGTEVENVVDAILGCVFVY